jgi:hypothetical protein
MSLHPLDILLDWYTQLATDKQESLAIQILLYIPDFSLPISLDELFSQKQSIEYFHNYINESKAKNIPQTIGVTLCLRSIITYHLRKYNQLIDEQILDDISLRTAVVEKLSKKCNEDDIKKLKKCFDINPYHYSSWTQINDSWKLLCNNALNDEYLSKWLLSNHEN